ncbi:MAG: hypothetical protein RLZZ15_2245, partial [Verrucomicrobiota bacterium]
MRTFFLAACAAAVSGAHAAAPHQLVKLWETPPALFSCESVRYSAGETVLYVSNMGPSKSPGAKDGDGSIGKVGLDGKVIAAEWIKGLDAPKGLGLYEGRLYVADIDRVVVIDVAKGTIKETIPIAGAGSLNDLTIDMKGVVYVSDHKLGKIYAINDGEVSVFIADVKN